MHQQVNQGRIRDAEIDSAERKRGAFGNLDKPLVKQYIPGPSANSGDTGIWPRGRSQKENMHQEVNQGRIRVARIIFAERKRDTFGNLAKPLGKQYIPGPSAGRGDPEIGTRGQSRKTCARK